MYIIKSKTTTKIRNLKDIASKSIDYLLFHFI